MDSEEVNGSSSSSQKKCSVGLALNEDCHKLTYSRKCGFLS